MKKHERKLLSRQTSRSRRHFQHAILKVDSQPFNHSTTKSILTLRIHEGSGIVNYYYYWRQTSLPNNINKIESAKKIKIENVKHLTVHESLCHVSDCQSSKYHDHDIKKGVLCFSLHSLEMLNCWNNRRAVTSVTRIFLL